MCYVYIPRHIYALVRALAGDVARRVVLADGDGVQLERARVAQAAAQAARAPDLRRGAPHHLRVLAAAPPRRRRARVAVAVVPPRALRPARRRVRAARTRGPLPCTGSACTRRRCPTPTPAAPRSSPGARRRTAARPARSSRSTPAAARPRRARLVVSPQELLRRRRHAVVGRRLRGGEHRDGRRRRRRRRQRERQRQDGGGEAAVEGRHGVLVD